MSEKGFTLVEVLVALTVLALSLAVIMSGLSDGLSGRRTAADYQRAVTLAESKLTAMGADTALEEGQTGGVDGSFRWEAAVAPYHEEDADQTTKPLKPAATPFVLTVTVRWGPKDNERSVSLSTLRLAY